MIILPDLKKIPPLSSSIIVTILLLSSFFIVELLLGRIPPSPRYGTADISIAVLHIVLVGYTLAVYLSYDSLASGTLTRLVSNFPGEIDRQAVFGNRSNSALVISGTCGTVIGLLAPFLTAQSPWLPTTWTPEVYWHRILGLIFGWGFGICIYMMVKVSIDLSKAVRNVMTFNLFNIESTAPLVRHGMLNALIGVGWLSILAIWLFDSKQTPVVLAMGGLDLLIIGTGLILPVKGARDRIICAKRSELHWINESISKAVTKVRAEADQEAIDRLGQLAAYHQLVSRVAEWPFTRGTYIRALLYFLIPALSWVVGAVFESIFEQAFLR